MRIGADQHMHRRRAEQAIRIGVPAGLEQRAGARRGEADAIGDGGAGGEADGAVARQIEHARAASASATSSMRRHRRCRRVVAGILAPGR